MFDPTVSEAARASAALRGRLDAEQRAVLADFATPGVPVRKIAAVAGSGKTTLMVSIVDYVVRELHYPPEQVLVTTFTRKAADDDKSGLRVRLQAVLPPGTLARMSVGTTHSLGLKALRQVSGNRWDMSNCLDIYQRGSRIPHPNVLWRSILGAPKNKVVGCPTLTGLGVAYADSDIAEYRTTIDRLRAHRRTPDTIPAEDAGNFPRLREAWQAWDTVRHALGSFDFADVLEEWARGLEAGTLSTQYKLVVTDEAQDNAPVQLDIAKRLAKVGTLLVCGDPFQSIYHFRGADPSIFNEIDKVEGCRTFNLPNNYRSGAQIVSAGNSLTDGIEASVLARAAKGFQGRVEIRDYPTPMSLAAAVGCHIAFRVMSAKATGSVGKGIGTRCDHYAVLARTNAELTAYETQFGAMNIPFMLVGATPFWGGPAVTAFMGYVQLIGSDNGEAVRAVMNKPARMIKGEVTDRILGALYNGGTLNTAIQTILKDPTTQPYVARGLKDLLDDVLRLRALPWALACRAIAERLSPAPTKENITGEGTAEGRGSYFAIAEAGALCGSPANLLSYADRMKRVGEQMQANGDDPRFADVGGKVTLCTGHVGKGLEWPIVFSNWSRGSVPHSKATSEADAEEERRLAYVMATRAEHELYLCWSRWDEEGKIRGPSPYLETIAEYLNTDPTVLKADTHPSIDTHLNYVVDPGARHAPEETDEVADARLAAWNAIREPAPDKPVWEWAAWRWIDFAPTWAERCVRLDLYCDNVHPEDGPEDSVVFARQPKVNRGHWGRDSGDDADDFGVR